MKKFTTKIDPVPILMPAPNMSLSRQTYLSVEDGYRQKAKSNKTVFVTRDGIEDYRTGKMVFHKGGLEEANKMCTRKVPYSPEMLKRIEMREKYIKKSRLSEKNKEKTKARYIFEAGTKDLIIDDEF